MIKAKISTLSGKQKILIAGAVILAIWLLKTMLFPAEFLYAGTVDATKIDLTPQLSSSIGAINVQEGDHVEPNQELIILNCEDYKAEAKLADDDYNRNYRMFQKHAVSEQTLEQALERKQEADIHIQWCTIRSPIYGTVLSRAHEPGEIATPGSNILTLANIKDVWAFIYVPQPKIAQLRVGMKLKAILPEMNDREFEGTILKINSEAEFTPKNVQTRSERTRLVFGVKVSFLGANDAEILKPGMTVEIRLPGK